MTRYPMKRHRLCGGPIHVGRCGRVKAGTESHGRLLGQEHFPGVYKRKEPAFLVTSWEQAGLPWAAFDVARHRGLVIGHLVANRKAR